MSHITANDECLPYFAAELFGSSLEFFTEFFVVTVLLAVEQKDMNFNLASEDLLSSLTRSKGARVV